MKIRDVVPKQEQGEGDGPEKIIMVLLRNTLIKNINEFLQLSTREYCNQVVNPRVDNPHS